MDEWKAATFIPNVMDEAVESKNDAVRAELIYWLHTTWPEHCPCNSCIEQREDIQAIVEGRPHSYSGTKVRRGQEGNIDSETREGSTPS
jgi:hypothetical protein